MQLQAYSVPAGYEQEQMQAFSVPFSPTHGGAPQAMLAQSATFVQQFPEAPAEPPAFAVQAVSYTAIAPIQPSDSDQAHQFVGTPPSPTSAQRVLQPLQEQQQQPQHQHDQQNYNYQQQQQTQQPQEQLQQQQQQQQHFLQQQQQWMRPQQHHQQQQQQHLQMQHQQQQQQLQLQQQPLPLQQQPLPLQQQQQQQQQPQAIPAAPAYAPQQMPYAQIQYADQSGFPQQQVQYAPPAMGPYGQQVQDSQPPPPVGPPPLGPPPFGAPPAQQLVQAPFSQAVSAQDHWAGGLAMVPHAWQQEEPSQMPMPSMMSAEACGSSRPRHAPGGFYISNLAPGTTEADLHKLVLDYLGVGTRTIWIVQEPNQYSCYAYVELADGSQVGSMAPVLHGQTLHGRVLSVQATPWPPSPRSRGHVGLSSQGRQRPPYMGASAAPYGGDFNMPSHPVGKGHSHASGHSFAKGQDWPDAEPSAQRFSRGRRDDFGRFGKGRRDGKANSEYAPDGMNVLGASTWKGSGPSKGQVGPRGDSGGHLGGEAPRCDLFIGRLAENATEANLRDLFASARLQIRHLKIPCDADGQPKGYAFVSLADPSRTAYAIQQLSGKLVRGRPINVEPSSPGSTVKGLGAQPASPHGCGGKGKSLPNGFALRDGAGGGKSGNREARGGERGAALGGTLKGSSNPNKLFVGNLSSEATGDDVWQALQPAGEIVGMRVLEGKFSGIAFVEFKEPASVEKAVVDFQGVDICGRAVRLERQGGGSAPQSEGASLVNSTEGKSDSAEKAEVVEVVMEPDTHDIAAGGSLIKVASGDSIVENGELVKNVVVVPPAAAAPMSVTADADAAGGVAPREQVPFSA